MILEVKIITVIVEVEEYSIFHFANSLFIGLLVYSVFPIRMGAL